MITLDNIEDHSPVSQFPNEILGWVFKYLSTPDLARVSLLCRTCQALAFTHLHSHLYIDQRRHLNSLAARVTLDIGEGPLSIISHCKWLSIYTCAVPRVRTTDNISLCDLGPLDVLASKLTSLTRLSWKSEFVPDVCNPCVRWFQTRSPGLKKLELKFTSAYYGKGKPGNYASMLNFTNLTDITLHFPDIMFVGSYIQYLPPLTRLLASCPDLVSLQLQNYSLYPLSITNIVASLGDRISFPRLRIFHVRWAWRGYHPEHTPIIWGDFFAPSTRRPHPVRSFFLHHQTIEDLALGWLPDSPYEGEIDPGEIVQMFPSLKHFEGPGFLCNAMAKSEVAQRLESLAVADMTFADERDWLAEMAVGSRDMPKLRSLRILADDVGEIIESPTLASLVKLAPALEVLECRTAIDGFAGAVLALSCAPNLRHMIITGYSWVVSAISKELLEKYPEHDINRPNDDDWKGTVLKIATHCHRLEMLQSYDEYLRVTEWRVERGQKGDILDVVFTRKIRGGDRFI